MMTYTEEMTTSEILLRLASMRNELLQAVNDIEKISKNICYKAEQTENSSEKPNNCETCEHYKLTCDLFSEICKYEPKDEPTISKMEQVDKGINVPSKNESQKCSVNGRPYSECSSCEHFRCTADEPQVLNK